MINQLDETLRKLVLARGNLSADSITVSFDQPTGDWAAGLTRPTVNFYLYDIRENAELRSQEWIIEHDATGQATRRPAPLRFDLSYVVTVWTQNQVEDEHAILWRVLGALAGTPVLAIDLLEPGLQNQPYPILTRTAQPSRAIENLPDLWGVMENQLRPSLNYTVTLAMEREVAFTSPLVISRRFDYVEPTSPDTRSSSHQIGGVVYREQDRQTLAGARVTLTETGQSDTTDEFGRFRLSGLSAGGYHVRVHVDGSDTDHTIAVPSEDLQAYDLTV